MKTQLIAVSLIGLFLISASLSKANADNVKLAYVDLRRALNETTEGKAAMSKLTKLKDQLQKTAIRHGFDAIKKQINKNLLEQTGITVDQGGSFRDISHQLDLLDFCLIADQIQNIRKEEIDRHGFPVALGTGVGKIQEILDD